MIAFFNLNSGKIEDVITNNIRIVLRNKSENFRERKRVSLAFKENGTSDKNKESTFDSRKGLESTGGNVVSSLRKLINLVQDSLSTTVVFTSESKHRLSS